MDNLFRIRTLTGSVNQMPASGAADIQPPLPG